jgi:predicted enzyme related to lactoylglutathione lyase
MLSTDFAAGAPNWVDLGVPDVSAAAAFYRATLGWEFRSAGPDAGGYGFFTLGGKTVAAAGPLGEPGASPRWTIYFHSPDADVTAEAVRKAGGTVSVEPMDVSTHGRMAEFGDPAGARFALWQPGDTKGLEAVNDPGTLCWAELHTSDTAAAKGFYQAVFGWETDDMSMGEFTYTVIRPAGGGGDSGQGGITPLETEPAGVRPYWLPYFEVADCDATVATATRQGGTVRMPPTDIPGTGRFAALADPAGAVFAVIASVAP